MSSTYFETVLQAVDRLQYEAAVKGDDEEWGRLAELRTEVNVARAGEEA